MGILTTVVDPSKLEIILFSEGIKSQPDHKLTPADLIVDCRIMRLPKMADESVSGKDLSYQDWSKANNLDELINVERMIIYAIRRLPDRRGEDKLYSKPFTINFFCAHGVHRSVSTKIIISQIFRQAGWKVEVK